MTTRTRTSSLSLPLSLPVSLAMVLALAACADAPVKASAASAAAASSSGQSGEEVSIAFANQGGIRNWQSVGDDALLIEDGHGQWYLAKLQSASGDLAFAEQVAFLTDPSGSFGRLSAVSVKGVRYPVLSLTHAQAPGKKKAAKAP